MSVSSYNSSYDNATSRSIASASSPPHSANSKYDYTNSARNLSSPPPSSAYIDDSMSTRNTQSPTFATGASPSYPSLSNSSQLHDTQSNTFASKYKSTAQTFSRYSGDYTASQASTGGQFTGTALTIDMSPTQISFPQTSIGQTSRISNTHASTRPPSPYYPDSSMSSTRPPTPLTLFSQSDSPPGSTGFPSSRAASSPAITEFEQSHQSYTRASSRPLVSSTSMPSIGRSGMVISTRRANSELELEFEPELDSPGYTEDTRLSSASTGGQPPSPPFAEEPEPSAISMGQSTRPPSEGQGKGDGSDDDESDVPIKQFGKFGNLKDSVNKEG